MVVTHVGKFLVRTRDPFSSDMQRHIYNIQEKDFINPRLYRALDLKRLLNRNLTAVSRGGDLIQAESSLTCNTVWPISRRTASTVLESTGFSATLVT